MVQVKGHWTIFFYMPTPYEEPLQLKKK